MIETKTDGLFPAQLFELAAPIHLAHERGIIAPIAADAHAKFEINLRSKQRF
jgi:hypothetical protein